MTKSVVSRLATFGALASLGLLSCDRNNPVLAASAASDRVTLVPRFENATSVPDVDVVTLVLKVRKDSTVQSIPYRKDSTVTLGEVSPGDEFSIVLSGDDLSGDKHVVRWRATASGTAGNASSTQLVNLVLATALDTSLLDALPTTAFEGASLSLVPKTGQEIRYSTGDADPRVLGKPFDSTTLLTAGTWKIALKQVATKDQPELWSSVRDIVVSAPQDNDTTTALSFLTATESAPLTPEFSATTSTYKLTVPHSATTVGLLVGLVSKSAKLFINGTECTAGQGKLSVVLPENDTILLNVTNGKYARTCTVTVVRSAAVAAPTFSDTTMWHFPGFKVGLKQASGQAIWYRANNGDWTPYTDSILVTGAPFLLKAKAKTIDDSSEEVTDSFRIATRDTSTYGIPWNNAVGIKYDSLLDARDGHVYRTVTIGTQTWMAENLDFRNWTGAKDSVGNCYLYNASNCDKFGRLYSWDAARSACPAGWHLPSKPEWDALITAAGGATAAGFALKSAGGWNTWNGSYQWSGDGHDSLGMRLLPSGAGTQGASGLSWAGTLGSYAYFWTATEGTSSAKATNVRFFNESASATFQADAPIGGLHSVRCVKD